MHIANTIQLFLFTFIVWSAVSPVAQAEQKIMTGEFCAACRDSRHADALVRSDIKKIAEKIESRKDGQVILLDTMMRQMIENFGINGVYKFEGYTVENEPCTVELRSPAVAINEFVLPGAVEYTFAEPSRGLRGSDHLSQVTRSQAIILDSWTNLKKYAPRMFMHVPVGTPDSYQVHKWRIIEGGPNMSPSYFLISGGSEPDDVPYICRLPPALS